MPVNTQGTAWRYRARGIAGVVMITLDAEGKRTYEATHNDSTGQDSEYTTPARRTAAWFAMRGTKKGLPPKPRYPRAPLPERAAVMESLDEPETAAVADTLAEPEAAPRAEQGIEAEPQAELGSAPEPQTAPEPETAAVAEPEAEPVQEPQAEPEQQAEPRPEPALAQRPESEPLDVASEA